MSENLSIGFLGNGSHQWVAGILYLKSLAESLSSLPRDERPELRLIMPPQTDASLYKDLRPKLSGLHHYAYERGYSKKRLLKAFCSSWSRGRGAVGFERLVERLKLDVLYPCHIPLARSFPIPWVSWIPDFQHKRCPQFFSEQELEDRDRNFRQLIDDASHVIVSSMDAYDDLMRWFKPDRDKVSIYRYRMSIEDRFYLEDPKVIANGFGLPEKYLMFPSQFWVHKNHLNLFKALAILKQKGFKNIGLVLTGYHHDYRNPRYQAVLQNFIKDNSLNNNIFYLGLIPRQQQVQLLRRAAAIVQPSYFEGWSMLVEESRELGKRIYLSDLPIHREQGHPDCVYFDPDSPEAIADSIARDWKTLSPGPNLKKEREARSTSKKVSMECARDYMNIIRKTVKV